MCARQMGWSLVVALDELQRADPEARREVQVALGYPEEPLLGDEAAWRAATPATPAAHPPCVVGGDSAGP